MHGTLNLVQAIAKSCDIYFYELGARLDVDDIYNAAQRYGLTEATGIDLPHEAVSRVPSREWKRRVKQEKWYAGETISVAIGQGANSLTPIALARFYAMIATKGKLLTPHLLYGVRPDNGGDIDLYQPPAPKDTGLDPKIWGTLDEGLYEVVPLGHGPGLGPARRDHRRQDRHQPGGHLRGQGALRRPGQEPQDNALFAGYAPRENPQIAFAVVAANAGFGADSAAPIVKKLCQVPVHRPHEASPCRPPAPSCPTPSGWTRTRAPRTNPPR